MDCKIKKKRIFIRFLIFSVILPLIKTTLFMSKSNLDPHTGKRKYTKRTDKVQPTPLAIKPTPEVEERAVTAENYTPGKYKILSDILPPSGRGEVFWPEYEFNLIPKGQAAFIPEEDPNANIARAKKAITQFLREPASTIRSGKDAGSKMKFNCKVGYDSTVNPPQKGLVIFRVN